MAVHVFRFIDPSPEEVSSAWEEAYLRAAREHSPANTEEVGTDRATPADLIASAARLPEGLYAQTTKAGERYQDPVVIVVACWWTDIIRRRHWHIEGTTSFRPAHYLARPSHLHKAVPNWAENWEGMIPGAHPLGWVAPLSSGWRVRDGAREYVVVCRCGVCGTPAELGWAGETCGPCFDREQEGLPSVGEPAWRREVGLADAFVLAEGGLLITCESVQSDDGPLVLQIRAWRPPWTGPCVWELIREDASPPLLASNLELLAVGGFARAVTLVRLADGNAIAEAREESGTLCRAFFAGPERQLFLCLSRPWTGGFEAHVYSPGEGANAKKLRTFKSGAPAAVSPNGELLVAGNSEELHVFDLATGQATEALNWPRAAPTSLLAFGPDGSLFALSALSRISLARWAPTSPAPSAAPRRGLWSWLTGPSVSQAKQALQRRQPDQLRPVADTILTLAVAPDGDVIAGVAPGALIFWDTKSLEELARFEPAATFKPHLAFTQDGQLLAATDRGLAVWPWRELLGLR